MSQSQGIEVRRPSRRTIATGAAWAVPVIAVGAAAPLASASVTPCVPEFETQAGSFKCCNGPVKNMKLVIKVTDVNDCISSTSSICVTDVTLANGQDNGTVVFVPGGGSSVCVVEGGTFTVYLLDTDSCTVNLLVHFSVDGGPTQVTPVKSGNIPSGNSDGDCQP